MSFLLVFNRVHRLEIQSVLLVFSTSLVNERPSNLITGSPPPSPLCCAGRGTYVFIQCVMGGGGRGSGGVESIYMSYTLCI
jgi:hypothetical protein